MLTQNICCIYGKTLTYKWHLHKRRVFWLKTSNLSIRLYHFSTFFDSLFSILPSFPLLFLFEGLV